MKPTEPKKILCIHDLSGMGRCSLAVILPVLSVMGVQPVALPTVVLSTHTGGLGTPARMDGSAYGMAALEHYQAVWAHRHGWTVPPTGWPLWNTTGSWVWSLTVSTPAT